jgi:YgiT-type zinc finger domain-containing protein
MICLICRQAETVDGFTSVVLERGEMRFTVLSVPARSCPGCGEAYLEASVAEQLLESAERKFSAGDRHDIEAYDSL